VTGRRPRITLAYDEGPGAGLGHRRRIEALAHELAARSYRCARVSLEGSAMVAGRIAVIDSYRIRADDPGRVKAGVVVAIDDLARDLDVNLVVDPSPGASADAHEAARHALAGSMFALVAVPAALQTVAVDAAAVTRILVTTGAADEQGVGARLAAHVSAAVPGAEVRLVVGPWGATEVPVGVVGVHARDGLAAELAAAPVVVTAGGVAMLESCMLGRATIGVAIAENQQQAVRGLADAGAIVSATEANVAEIVWSLVSNPARRAALGAAARVALDGKGPARVADAIEELVA
jgi:spore coat polysaccharide biosynthesis predicted glycosyltransferase SpsG